MVPLPFAGRDLFAVFSVEEESKNGLPSFLQSVVVRKFIYGSSADSTSIVFPPISVTRDCAEGSELVSLRLAILMLCRFCVTRGLSVDSRATGRPLGRVHSTTQARVFLDCCRTAPLQSLLSSAAHSMLVELHWSPRGRMTSTSRMILDFHSSIFPATLPAVHSNLADMLLIGIDGMYPYGIVQACPPAVPDCIPGEYISRQRWGKAR